LDEKILKERLQELLKEEYNLKKSFVLPRLVAAKFWFWDK
jgi:hypothetical protein